MSPFVGLKPMAFTDARWTSGSVLMA